MASSSSMQFTSTAAGAVFQNSENIHIENINVNMQIDENDFDIPLPIETFTGREEELEQLKSLFLSTDEKLRHRGVVICGIPGIGKSELAKKFVNLYMKDEKVYWIRAENVDNIQRSFKTLKNIYRKCIGTRTLFIFDNAISRNDITEYEPPDKRNHLLLITSQYKDWGSDIKPLELQPLLNESAIQVFRIILGNDFKDEDLDAYKKLANIVGYMPLGLQITSAYIRHEKKKYGKKFDLHEYTNKLERSQKEIIEAKAKSLPWVGNPYGKSLYGAIEVSLNKIITEENLKVREIALQVLYTCSYLNADFIYKTYLLNIPNICALLKEKNDDDLLWTALVLLDDFSLINYHPDKVDVQMHRFIQIILRYHLSEHDTEMQNKCYTACLQFLLERENYFSKNHSSTIFTYADDNLTIFYNFYLKNSTAKAEILVNCVKYGCIKCLEIIFQHHSAQIARYIINFKLLHVAVRYDTSNFYILKLLLRYANNRRALYVAAYECSLRAVQFLLPTCIFERQEVCNTALFELMRGIRYRELINCNDVSEILKLLKLTENTNITNDNEETLLHVSVASCNVYLVDLLVNTYKLDVNRQDKNGDTPLHVLISQLSNDNLLNITATAKILVSENAMLNIKNKNGVTPLDLAVHKKFKYLVKLFILSNKNDTQELKKLFDDLGECSKEYINEYNLLHICIFSGNIEKLYMLLQYGVDINKKDYKNDSPLHVAAKEWDLQAIRILLNHKPDLTAKNNTGNTALFELARQARFHNELIGLSNILDMLTCDDSSCTTNNNGDTLLHFAAASHNDDFVKLLMTKYTMNVNKENKQGRTPLHAIFNLSINDRPNGTEKVIEIINVLKNKGARLNITDESGSTPLDLARRHKAEYLIPYLTS